MILKQTEINNLKGIRISVKSLYLKKFFFGKIINYKFKNILTIYNNGKNTIQILSNHKKIFDLYGISYLNKQIRHKPILKPGNKLKLELNYSLKTQIATIFGYFSIICLNSTTKFKAYIPVIKLSTNETLN